MKIDLVSINLNCIYESVLFAVNSNDDVWNY